MFVFSAEVQTTAKAAEKCILGKILRDMQDTCCKKECIKGVSPQTVLSKRTLYWGKTSKDRMAYVYHAIETGRMEEKGNLLMVESGLVCANACFYERLEEMRKGEKKEDKPRQQQKTLACDLAVEWFRNFAKTQITCRIHLQEPFLHVSQNWLSINYTRTRWMIDQSLTGATLSTICGKQNSLTCLYHRYTDLRNVQCVHLAERLRSPGLKKETRQELSFMRKVHLTQQMTEREKYYKHGEKAKKNPKKYLSVTIDGMDQNKHNLPHFNISTKTDGSAWRLKTHVTGVLNNLHTRAFEFLDMCEWPHGSNLTINVLFEVINSNGRYCYEGTDSFAVCGKITLALKGLDFAKAQIAQKRFDVKAATKGDFSEFEFSDSNDQHFGDGDEESDSSELEWDDIGAELGENTVQEPSREVKPISLVDGDMYSWMFPAEFCQLSIDGRNGSNACSLISLAVAHTILTFDISLLLGSHLHSDWSKLFYLCMRLGNALYDKACWSLPH
ncbi:hypothetical protein ACROYT_G014637 [Oculina patagonica]